MRLLMGPIAVLVVASCLIFQGMLYFPLARADSAPMWESPVGLKPGLVDNKVRMVAETVEVQVIERDGAVYAKVNATFELLNRGPDAEMKVGFPQYNYPVNVGEYPKQVGFSPSLLEDFRAWSGNTRYQPKAERVVLDPREKWGDEWFVWDMAFRRGAQARLNVSYDQNLGTGLGAVNVFYVLTTGALWDGTIGDATITMTASDGGFVMADPVPAQTGVSRATWRMRDFEPTEDVRAVYVPAATWRALRATSDAVKAGTASAADYVIGAQAIVQMTEDGMRAGEERQRLRESYFPQAKEWSRTAIEMDDANAAAWEALADLESASVRSPKGFYDCRPPAVEDNYQRAIDLGSPTAAAKLAEIQEATAWQESVVGPLEPCY